MDNRTGQNFYAAAVPEPWTILGFELKPFSLGHLILLHRVESWFVVGGEGGVQYEDLALSVFICSRSYKEALEGFNDPRLPTFMRRWAKKLERRPTLRHKLGRFVPWRWHRKKPFKWLGLRVAEPIDLEGKAAEFSQYLNQACQPPYYSYDPSKTAPINAETAQVIRAGLLAKTSLTEEKIMNQPYGLTLSDWLTVKAINGDIRLEDRMALENARKVAEQLAKVTAEGGLHHA